MVRNFVALAALTLAGTLIPLPEPAFAAGGARGGMRAFFRAPLNMHRSPRAVLSHRPFLRPRAFGHRPPATRPYGTIIPSTPYGTVKPSIPYGTVAASTAYGTVAPVTRTGLVRRHHRAHHQGWSFPVTVGYDAGYIGTPYDPAEIIPVYGPAATVEEADPGPGPSRLTRTRDPNADACRSERVTVPAADGEREITVVRC